MTEELVAWLPEQRWFRAKQRPISPVATVDRAVAGPAEVRVLEVAYRDGGPPDLYLAPLVDGRDPRDGDGAWAALVSAIGEGGELRGERGIFVGRPTAAVGEAVLATATERMLGVEQSNTSVVIGERLIL